jgi:heme/copper-type cytochrome/quinol oxidase subunit 3
MPDGASAMVAPTESELTARNLWAGGRLASAGMAFVMISFVFAFYYLRELNIEHMWRPKGVHPPLGFGIAILACMLVSAGLYWLAARASHPAGGETWLPLAGVALLLGLATIVLIGIEIPKAGFTPSSGAYASVFFGWTGFFGVAVLGGVYYLETMWARAARAGVGGTDPVVLAGESGAFATYWNFMAAMTVLFFVLLYLVA